MNLWQELLRRKVLRTSGLYIVGAWLVLQVADILFPAWGLPEAGIRYLFIAGAAGFPIALVFGWFYDITPHGIVRTDPSHETEIADLRLKRTDLVILFALAAIGAAILYGSIGKIRETVESAPATTYAEVHPNSIAVLPFANLDPNPDTRYFSDGITEEILHRLSTLGSLHVLASNSSFAFANSQEGPDSISRKLGVRFLLQGSVRRDKDFVRITARLVNESGFQLWSSTFDRKLESIFVVQSEIARFVSEEIVDEIVPLQELPAGRTTENMEAYTAYLQGRAYFNARTRGWQERAETAFRRAIELDPGYAPPYAGLATLVVNSNRGPHWAEARDNAARSLQLDPDLPLGHATLGLTLAVLDESEQGLESLQRAIELDPSLAIAYSWMTMPLRDLGRDDEASVILQKGLEIDPLNSTLIKNISEYESRHGNFERAEQLLLRLTKLPEPAGRSYAWLYMLYDEWNRFPQAVDAAKNNLRLALGNSRDPEFEFLFFSYAKLGMTDDAEYWFDMVRSQMPSGEPPIDLTALLAPLGCTHWLAADLQQAEKLVNEDARGDLPYLLSYGGLAWVQAGDIPKSIDWLERGIAMYQRQMKPDDPPDGIDYGLLIKNWGLFYPVLIAERLAFAYQQNGQEKKSAEALRFLSDINQAKEGLGNPSIFESRALERILSNDPDGAIKHLRQALDLGWANYYLVTNDRVWAETAQAPEFQELLSAARETIERQRKRVETADAGHDFRAEVEALTSD